MLLCPDEVKYFVSYSLDYERDTDKYYNEVIYDIIDVYFKKNI